MSTKTMKEEGRPDAGVCPACQSGLPTDGPLPGILASGERCPSCVRFPSDEAALEAAAPYAFPFCLSRTRSESVNTVVYARSLEEARDRALYQARRYPWGSGAFCTDYEAEPC